MAVDYDKVSQLERILESLGAAHECELEAGSIAQPTPVDEVAVKTELRNRVLAGDGVKAAFWGTLSAPPTITAANLQTLGWTAAAANAAIAERDRLRAYFLTLVT